MAGTLRVYEAQSVFTEFVFTAGYRPPGYREHSAQFEKQRRRGGMRDLRSYFFEDASGNPMAACPEGAASSAA